MPAPSFAAPLIVLDEDACSPFTFSLPDALLHLPADRVNKHAKAVTAAAAAEMPPSTPGDVQFASKSPAMVDPASISAPATDVKHTVGGSSNQLTAEHLHVGPEAATAASSSHSKGRAFVAVQLGNWYGLVQRGNCPFDVKVLNAQRAGLAGVIIYNSVLAAARSRDQPVRMSSNAVGGEITETHASFLTNYDAQCIINAASSTGEGNHSSHGVMNTFGRFPLTGVRTHPRLLLVSLSTDAWPRNGWFSPAFDPLNTNSVIKPVGTAANVNKLSAVSMVADIVLIAVILLTSTALCFIACILIALLRNYFCHGRLFVVFYGPPQSRANGGAARRRTPRRPPTAGAHHVTGEETSLIEGNVDGNQQPAADAAIANTNPAQLRTGRRFGFSAFFGGYSIAQDHEDLQVDDEDSSEDDDDDGVLEKITLPIRIIEARDLMDCDGSSSRISEDGLGGGAVGGSKECCAICIDEFLIGSRVRKLPCNHQFHDACIDPWLINHNRLCPICKRDVLMPTDKARLKTSRIAEEETATAPAQLTRRATLVMEEGDGRNSNGASGNGSLRSSFSEVFGFSRWGIQWGGKISTAGELPGALTTQTDQE
ncbi:hypothetical protein DFJ73DRAFT_807076 [Zopfochytrium polystomum]|nr:hypothetical protein DFJ73DRAFT_807076 [Zopfochytrium polystomum]